MPILIVVNDPKQWPFQIPNVDVIDARSYLTRPEYSDMRGVKVFNLCKSYKYQSAGYYVSLLAEARGHKPLPSVTTIQDLKSQAIVRLVSEDLEELIQQSLAPIQSDEFTLSIYFGRNLARRYDRLSLQLFDMFQSPLLRAKFVRDKRDREWSLHGVEAISASEVPESHWPFVVQVATEHFSGRRARVRRRTRARYDLAILYAADDPEPPSDEKAIKRFVRAAESMGLDTDLIGRDDYARLAEYDALFIRATTYVNHYTYRFARRAASEGLVVMDDPESIVKCTNKVYLAELLGHHGVPVPKTLMIHDDNIDAIPAELGFPCVLKKPDKRVFAGRDQDRRRRAPAQAVEGDARRVGPDRRPGVFADDLRLADRDRRPPAAVRLQILHGAQPLADHPPRWAGKTPLWQVRNLAGGIGPGQGHPGSPPRGESHRQRPLRRRRETVGRPVLRDRSQRQPEHRLGRGGRDPETGNLPQGHERFLATDRTAKSRIHYPMSSPAPLHLFEAFGVELEYMIVDAQTLAVLPISDKVLYQVAGDYVSQVDLPDVAWSNELVLHVIELKTVEPAPALEPLAEKFHEHIGRVNELLEPLGGRLMPSAMHPWMNPWREMRLWPHEYSPVYEAYHRIFDCRGHGWANLQSVHLNLPFADDAEFGRLHAAIRLLLPIMPALAASSPIMDRHVTGLLDNRLDVYRTNARKVPFCTGLVVPEPVFTQADYQREILQRMYRDIAPLDPEGVLQDEFLNSRGAIARFERGSIEVRVLDVQECPAADLAICQAITSVLRALVAEPLDRPEDAAGLCDRAVGRPVRGGKPHGRTHGDSRSGVPRSVWFPRQFLHGRRTVAASGPVARTARRRGGM